MRTKIKTISSKAQKFIPKGHEGFDENAKDIQDRPLVIMGRPLTREDRLNISSLMDTKTHGGEVQVANLGTVSKYIWEHCALEVRNIIAEEGNFEVVKGADKDRLFSAQGMEDEIFQFVGWIQEISRLTEDEVKN